MKIMSFNYFVRKDGLKKKATSNIKIQNFLSSLSFNEVGICLRHGLFKSDERVVSLHPSKGTYWFAFINGKYFHGCGCVCPKKLSRFIIKRKGHCLNFGYKIQGLTNKRDSYCARYCL